MKYVYLEEYLYGEKRLCRYKVVKTICDNQMIVHDGGVLKRIKTSEIICEAPEPWWVVLIQFALFGIGAFLIWKILSFPCVFHD